MSRANNTWENTHPICPNPDFTCPYYNITGRCNMFEKENCLPYEECDAWYSLDEEDEEEEENMVRDIYNIAQWTDSELSRVRGKIDQELEDRRSNRDAILRDLIYRALSNYEEFLGSDQIIGYTVDGDFCEVSVYLSEIKNWFSMNNQKE